MVMSLAIISLVSGVRTQKVMRFLTRICSNRSPLQFSTYHMMTNVAQFCLFGFLISVGLKLSNKL